MANSAVVVAGDVTIDWLEVPMPARGPVAVEGTVPFNWQLYPGTRMLFRPGGALLLARFLEQAVGQQVVTHYLDVLRPCPSEEAIHSLVELGRFPSSSSSGSAGGAVFRVKRLAGYAGPASGLPKVLEIRGDDPDARIVVLDDAGNGFRDVEERWPAAIRAEGKTPVVVLKMSRPLARGKLWNTLRTTHADRLVVVVSADHLREQQTHVSRGLSWERTATDLVWQLACNPELVSLGNCLHLVVRFGIDGAIHYSRRAGRIESRLYYDPAVAEGGARDACPGDMLGFTTAFCAALTKRIAQEGLPGVGEGVRDGILASRRLLQKGFGTDPDGVDYPVADLFGPAASGEAPIADIVVPPPSQPDQPDPGYWCILKDLAGSGLEELAYDIVIRGQAPKLRGVPVGRFRLLRTIDRTEIEGYRSVRNLIGEYLAAGSPKRPLSIAVFGPPGSGKSFGVTQVAESVAPGGVSKLEFNVAQFRSLEDLTRALHKVHDVSIGGQVPLVFFDEFDSDLGGAKLGWLKYFLSPMQDGSFQDGETVHPIGKAVFVFAGATSNTFEEFAREDSRGGVVADTGMFRDAKGPDFVSRLRGFVNVMGANRQGEHDGLYIIRRAMFLRTLLELKARHLFDSTGRALIDAGVLRALIRVPYYKHGIRSMESIIDMSMLAGRRQFEQATLPPPEQMELHVNARAFSRLVARNALFGAEREKLARAVHEQYRREQKGTKGTDDPSMQCWKNLPENLKESNLQQADHIPEKLRRIGYEFVPAAGGREVTVEFTAEEVEILAQMEHDRWIAERRLGGWSLGPRDPEKKISPYLVGWDELSDDVREWDRKSVRQIPRIMADAGFAVYRIE